MPTLAFHSNRCPSHSSRSSPVFAPDPAILTVHTLRQICDHGFALHLYRDIFDDDETRTQLRRQFPILLDQLSAKLLELRQVSGAAPWKLCHVSELRCGSCTLRHYVQHKRCTIIERAIIRLERFYSVAVITSGSDRQHICGVGHPGDPGSIPGKTYIFAIFA